MRIGHFTPSYTPICAGQVAQILRETETLSERLNYDYRWWSEEQSDIVAVRNRNLQTAINMECDYLCMQDSDIRSKASIGAIAPMLQTAREHDATMVAAICGLRRKPHRANVEPVIAGEVYRAEKVGTGLVLIDCKQVAKWSYDDPWFQRLYNDRATNIEVGEDIFFSRLINEMGGSIWVDGRVPTTHVNRDVETLDYPGNATAGDKADKQSNPAESGSA